MGPFIYEEGKGHEGGNLKTNGEKRQRWRERERDAMRRRIKDKMEKRLRLKLLQNECKVGTKQEIKKVGRRVCVCVCV